MDKDEPSERRNGTVRSAPGQNVVWNEGESRDDQCWRASYGMLLRSKALLHLCYMPKARKLDNPTRVRDLVYLQRSNRPLRVRIDRYLQRTMQPPAGSRLRNLHRSRSPHARSESRLYHFDCALAMNFGDGVSQIVSCVGVPHFRALGLRHKRVRCRNPAPKSCHHTAAAESRQHRRCQHRQVHQRHRRC